MIEKINQNYNRNIANSYRTNVQARSYNPSFGNKKLANDILELLPDKRALKFFDKLKWLKGEIGGILITAIGTGAIAPIFIAFNPCTKAPKNATPEEKKEVENTKKYTAMRQPISAALAVLFQVGALKPIDMFLDNTFDKPKNAKKLWVALDQSLLNNDSYIEKLAKKELKGQKFPDKKAYKDRLEDLKDEIKDRQITELSNSIKANNQIIINGKTLDNKYVAEVINKNIDKYIEDIKFLQVDTKGLNFYKNRAKLILANQNRIREVLGNVPGTDLEKYLTEQMQKPENKNIKELITEILGNHENMRVSRCKRTVDRIDKIKEACGGKYSSKKYIGSMLDDNNKLETLVLDLEDCKINTSENISADDIKKAMEKLTETCTIKENDKSFKRIFRNLDIMMENPKELVSKLYKDVAKKYRENLMDRYKGFNQVSKIVIGLLITLPITCTALNWVYPRFMEIFFPKLSGVKKADNNENKNGGVK